MTTGEQSVKCQYCKRQLSVDASIPDMSPQYALESHWLNDCEQVPPRRYRRLNNTHRTGDGNG